MFRRKDGFMDALDLEILQALQANARVKIVELARDQGVASSTILERIRRLEESGAIADYRALISPSCVGLNIQAFIAISLNRHQVDALEEFEQGVQQIPHVRVCYYIAGRFDYLLHVAARDLEQLGKLIKQRIATIPGISKVETFSVFSVIKPDAGWPIGIDPFNDNSIMEDINEEKDDS
jgi:Lrp/AsnC family leucine-responsive transcriptional regulator